MLHVHYRLLLYFIYFVLKLPHFFYFVLVIRSLDSLKRKGLELEVLDFTIISWIAHNATFFFPFLISVCLPPCALPFHIFFRPRFLGKTPFVQEKSWPFMSACPWYRFNLFRPFFCVISGVSPLKFFVFYPWPPLLPSSYYNYTVFPSLYDTSFIQHALRLFEKHKKWKKNVHLSFCIYPVFPIYTQPKQPHDFLEAACSRWQWQPAFNFVPPYWI